MRRSLRTSESYEVTVVGDEIGIDDTWAVLSPAEAVQVIDWLIEEHGLEGYVTARRRRREAPEA